MSHFNRVFSNNINSNILVIRKFFLLVILLSVIIQIIIDYNNIVSIGIVFFTTLILLKYTIKEDIIKNVPLPFLLVVSFNFSNLSGALIVQSLSFTSFVEGLNSPIFTFTSCAIFQLVLIATLSYFKASEWSYITSKNINKKVFCRWKLMGPLQSHDLWVLGAIGCATMIWRANSIVEFGDITGKFLLSLGFFIYAPYLIYVNKYLYQNSTYKPINFLPIFIYFLITVVIGIASNSRGIFSLGVFNFLLIFFLLFCIDQFKLSFKLGRKILVSIIIFIILSPILSDIAISMVIVRSDRNILSPIEIIDSTFSTFSDKDALRKYKLIESYLAEDSDYNEVYISNPFFSRLITTKFTDNTVSLDNVIKGTYKSEVFTATKDKFLAIFPTNLLNFSGIYINKDDLAYSMGDILIDKEYSYGQLGGYKTGSVIGHGLSLMGSLFYIFIIPVIILLFILTQSMTTISTSHIIISPVILFQMSSVYYVLSLDSIVEVLNFIIRTIPQSILIYWIFTYLVRVFIPTKN